jgi:hypothetical protein
VDDLDDELAAVQQLVRLELAGADGEVSLGLLEGSHFGMGFGMLQTQNKQQHTKRNPKTVGERREKVPCSKRS